MEREIKDYLRDNSRPVPPEDNVVSVVEFFGDISMAQLVTANQKCSGQQGLK